MAFWVYGRDAETGLPTEPFFTEAGTADEAREQAASQGMVVESVTPHAEGEGPSAPAELAFPPPAVSPPAVAPVATESPEASASPQYEFTPEQDVEIAALAWYMYVLGWVLVVFAALGVFIALSSRDPVPRLVQGVVGLTIGALTVYAAGAFRRIVDTRGRDIDHLMEALSGLRSIYAIQFYLLLIALVILAMVLLS